MQELDKNASVITGWNSPVGTALDWKMQMSWDISVYFFQTRKDLVGIEYLVNKLDLIDKHLELCITQIEIIHFKNV